MLAGIYVSRQTQQNLWKLLTYGTESFGNVEVIMSREDQKALTEQAHYQKLRAEVIETSAGVKINMNAPARLQDTAIKMRSQLARALHMIEHRDRKLAILRNKLEPKI
jgi:hypothetical protein